MFIYREDLGGVVNPDATDYDRYIKARRDSKENNKMKEILMKISNDIEEIKRDIREIKDNQ